MAKSEKLKAHIEKIIESYNFAQFDRTNMQALSDSTFEALHAVLEYFSSGEFVINFLSKEKAKESSTQDVSVLIAYLQTNLQRERRNLDGFVKNGFEIERAKWLEDAVYTATTLCAKRDVLDAVLHELEGVKSTNPMVLRGIKHAIEIVESLKEPM